MILISLSKSIIFGSPPVKTPLVYYFFFLNYLLFKEDVLLDGMPSKPEGVLGDIRFEVAISNNDPCCLNFYMYCVLEYYIFPLCYIASDGVTENPSPLSRRSPSVIYTPRLAFIFSRMLKVWSSVTKFFWSSSRRSLI